MSNPILLKRSSVAGKLPAPENLVHRELALNFRDGLLAFKDADNQIRLLAGDALVNAGDQVMTGSLEISGALSFQAPRFPHLRTQTAVREGSLQLRAGGFLAHGDLLFEEGKGPIFRSAGGVRYRVCVNRRGVLETEPVFEPETLTYLERLRQRFVLPGPHQQQAINRFIALEKHAGRWQKMSRLFLPFWRGADANLLCACTGNTADFDGSVIFEAGGVRSAGGHLDLTYSTDDLSINTANAYVGFLHYGLTGTGNLGYFGNAEFDVRSAGGQMSVEPGGVTWATPARTGILSCWWQPTHLQVWERRRSTRLVRADVSYSPPTTGSDEMFLFMTASDGGFSWSPSTGRFGAFFLASGFDEGDDEAFTLNLQRLWQDCTGLLLPA
jgi:hypothetical protein